MCLHSASSLYANMRLPSGPILQSHFSITVGLASGDLMTAFSARRIFDATSFSTRQLQDFRNSFSGTFGKFVGHTSALLLKRNAAKLSLGMGPSERWHSSTSRNDYKSFKVEFSIPKALCRSPLAHSMWRSLLIRKSSQSIA
jgi:hypothetical protein